MAFLGRVGNVLKKTLGRHADSCSSASRPSLFQAIRLMSSSKVFVGGLSYGTDDVGLREAFSQYGEIVDARVIVDRETGRSRGFGFITYTSGEEASSAIQALDGQEVHGRRVRVAYASDRARGGGFGQGAYGGGGGGYGGGQGGYGGGYGGQGGYGGGYGSQGGYGGGQGGYEGGGQGGYGGGGQGGYGGGGGSYGGQGGYGGGGGYGSSSGGYGASPAGGQGGYGSGGANYGGGYGAGNSDGIGSYSGGGGSDPAGFGSSGLNTGVNYGVSGGNVGGDSGFTSSGFEDGSGLGDKRMGEPADEEHEPSEPMDKNYRDEEEAEDDDYAKRA